MGMTQTESTKDNFISPISLRGMSPLSKLILDKIYSGRSSEDHLFESTVDPDIESPETTSDVSDESEIPDIERENWSGRLDFLLSCIGFAVGLGNIWRFPYLCYKSGGGAFLIPYSFFLITCGLPLFFMEISYGQFASLSPISVWRISPLFKGLGYGMVIISGIVCIYYNIIITWNFYFLFQSMQSQLPWTLCDQYWNSKYCVVELGHRETSNDTSSNDTTYKTVSASEEFWERNVLELTSGIEDFGELRWPLFGCLVLAWIIVYLCLFKGVKSSGKVVYVTATFPYAVLVILLVRGVTLPGAQEGIKFYLIPDWTKIRNFKVWGDAAVQIFYSVGMAWGSLITMSSYNKFSNNVYRDAMIVPLINCGTSVFAGLVIFSVLGFMADSTGEPIADVVTQGPGLTFVAYPAAVAKMPFSQLWAILFFLMIFTIGLDSQFGMFETMTSAFIDEYPQMLRKRKAIFTAFMCMVEFLLGIPLVFQLMWRETLIEKKNGPAFNLCKSGGIYLLQIMDWYCATFSLMLLSLIECSVISWIYGVDRFSRDVKLMTGKQPCLYWRVMWRFITPSIVLFIWLFSVSNMEPVTYGSYVYPGWAIGLGWGMGAISLIPTPITAILAIRRETSGSVWQRIKKLSQPAANWGPSLTEDRLKYLDSFNQYERERYEAAQRGIDRDRYLQTGLQNVNKNSLFGSPMTVVGVGKEDIMENTACHRMLPAGVHCSPN